MTRILTITALLFSLTAPAHAFVVGSPNVPGDWPSSDKFGPKGLVTRDSVAK